MLKVLSIFNRMKLSFCIDKPIHRIHRWPTNVDISAFVGCFFGFPHGKPTKSFLLENFFEK